MLDETARLTPRVYGVFALRQHRLDQAAGIRRITPRVARYLELYRLALTQEFETMDPVARLNHQIQQTLAEIRNLAKIAESVDDPRPYLMQAEKLRVWMQEATEALEEIANPGKNETKKGRLA